MMSTNTDEQNPPQSQLGLEAARWLLRLRDTQPDPQDPHADLATRNEAFLDWLSTSAQHVRIFLEAYETHRRLGPLGPRQKINIDGPLRKRIADVIRIYGTPEHPATSAQLPATPPRVSRRKLIGIAAAAVTVAIGVSLLALNPFGSQTYSTRVGEQRTCKLDDGSMVYLNTDSRLEVDFSDRVRNIRLVRGEALFVVARNTHRPFIVTSNTAAVRAIGTRFNVRTRADATDVVVVEGVVQVTATGVNPAGSAESTPLPAVQLAPHQARSASPPAAAMQGNSMRLGAGEEARVTQGQVNARANAPISEALSWRERRLIFNDASLGEAAAEFNRYNRVQIEVDPSVSSDKRLTGIFDADRPQSLMLYAAQDDSLIVEPAGKNWVIRSR